MLLLHQSGSVKIGEVVRYTVTYTPAHDRILPSPPKLHLRIKNTSTIALRAAFVRGPYNLYAAAYPSTFNPNEKFENPRRLGVPEFEPYLKAGGAFSTELLVPEDVQKTAGTANRDGRSAGGHDSEVKSVSWIIEIASQVIFSASAAVHYEIMLARDEKSLHMGFAAGGGISPTPGQISDHRQGQGSKDNRHGVQGKGIYSRAITLAVDDTASLWNTPKFPEWQDATEEQPNGDGKEALVEDPHKTDAKAQGRQKKIHLVVLTHGLHGNLGADMLYLKEHIDATAKQAKIDARARKAKSKQEASQAGSCPSADGIKYSENEQARNDKDAQTATEKSEEGTGAENEEEDEEVIVRGFPGNIVRTEKGIKYLGKRLAKYVLAMTYPDQPYRPVTKKTKRDTSSAATKPETPRAVVENIPAHKHSTIEKEPYNGPQLAYKITSISFIAHSLGGLIQMYGVAYIQKHSPGFFDVIKPINFIALATPFLGLSNENPLYVKFALDFGLVGRTGQDLGLTWRAPTLARSGWGAIVASIGDGGQKRTDGQVAPESKPLLRILPTGPAHTVLKKFRNRTVYSNVVNDGIVPLRTSCLLFLDWQGLGRVEKARRENGLVGTVAEWGWAEITGQNSASPMKYTISDTESNDDTGQNTPTRQGHGGEVPQPPPTATRDDDTRSMKKSKNEAPPSTGSSAASDSLNLAHGSAVNRTTSPLTNFMDFFRPNSSSKRSLSPKHTKIYKRSQTIKMGDDSSMPTTSQTNSHVRERKTSMTSDHGDFDQPPPTTTFFESAGDVLKPPLPSVEYLLNPSSRPRTIFHDRVYHPQDIPPPPLKRRPASSPIKRRLSMNVDSDSTFQNSLPHQDSSLSSRDYDDTKNTNPNKDPRDVIDTSAMKVEEKIARAYHRDLSWRKVLVRLEPDAHNNMIVRRMFANAYGWPVIKHLCDTHFSDSIAALTPDDEEGNEEQAKDTNEGPDDSGGETRDAEKVPIKPLSRSDRTDSEILEATDKVPELTAPKPNALRKALQDDDRDGAPTIRRTGPDQETWDERYWSDSADDTEEEGDEDDAKRKSGEADAQVSSGSWTWTNVIAGKSAVSSPKGTSPTEIDKFLNNVVPAAHLGLHSNSHTAAESSNKRASLHADDDEKDKQEHV